MATKEDEAKFHAEKHYSFEESLSEIYRMDGPNGAEHLAAEPIKLLEVNSATVPSSIMPIGFGPSPASGLHFSSIIVEVTPEEFHRIRSNDLPLRHGWTIGHLIPRPDHDRT